MRIKNRKKWKKKTKKMSRIMKRKLVKRERRSKGIGGRMWRKKKRGKREK